MVDLAGTLEDNEVYRLYGEGKVWILRCNQCHIEFWIKNKVRSTRCPNCGSNNLSYRLEEI
jgi:predicted RNA-binding Zn-ribbon protein involved in translation (DUF1610 family)